ncbi:MAG: NADH-quinone oxidoreductase subunit J [Deltaproteobacteria bacterium]|nr:MAG: NADH-quinone oxidoreductase subunit J [Deltaproteobacteria bacterium]
MTATSIFFYACAALAVVSALAMLLNVRNTVASALCLVVTMISLAGVFLVLDAYLIAALQIMVYAGAIVVLFIFVVMLLNLRHDAFAPNRLIPVKFLACLLGVWALVRLAPLFARYLPDPATLPEGFGGYRHVGLALYTDFVLTFEVASFLLLGAMVGAVMLAKRRLD